MVLEVRGKQEDIARLTAELEGSQMTVAQAKEARAQQTLAVTQEMDTLQKSGLADGTFIGEGQGFGGIIEVEIEVEGGQITEVRIVSARDEDGAYLTMAQEITEDIVQAQSADVDTISGATFSSGGIREAAAQAIEKAEQSNE